MHDAIAHIQYSFHAVTCKSVELDSEWDSWSGAHPCCVYCEGTIQILRESALNWRNRSSPPTPIRLDLEAVPTFRRQTCPTVGSDRPHALWDILTPSSSSGANSKLRNKLCPLICSLAVLQPGEQTYTRSWIRCTMKQTAMRFTHIK